MTSPVRRDARRYRRRILTIGGSVFGLLFVVMAPMYVDGVEDDLETRVPDELAAAGFVGISATFEGQDGTIFCEAPLPNPEAARQAAYDVWGVRTIELDRSCRVNTDAAAATSPSTVVPSDASGDDTGDDAEGSDDAMTSSVRTTMPDDSDDSDDSDDEVVAETTVPSTTLPDGPAFESVTDAVSGTPQLSHLAVLLQESGLDGQFADPASDPVTLFAPSDDAFEALPADLLGGLRADPEALRALLVHHTAPGALMATDLADGELEMNDGTVHTVTAAPPTIDEIDISASDIDAPNGVVHIVDGVLIPAGIDSSETPVAAPVDVQLEGASITLTGSASTEAIRVALVEAAGAPGVAVADLLVVDPQAGLDQANAEQLGVLLGALRNNLINGRAGFDGETLYLTGTYLTEADREAATALATEVAIEPSLMPPPVATVDDAISLEDELNEYVGENPVLFEQSRADITEDSAAVLDQIALLAQQFDAIVITVRGHTDSDGNANDNLWLSRIRARAVRDALVERGLEGDIVLWEGFGSQQPVLVDNVEDKSASRRVEFDVEVLS